MENTKLRKFTIEIWLSRPSGKIRLGEVNIYAETEDKAIRLARANTEYVVSGVDNVSWHVHESQVAYTSSFPSQPLPISY